MNQEIYSKIRTDGSHSGCIERIQLLVSELDRMADALRIKNEECNALKQDLLYTKNNISQSPQKQNDNQELQRQIKTLALEKVEYVSRYSQKCDEVVKLQRQIDELKSRQQEPIVKQSQTIQQFERKSLIPQTNERRSEYKSEHKVESVKYVNGQLVEQSSYVDSQPIRSAYIPDQGQNIRQTAQQIQTRFSNVGQYSQPQTPIQNTKLNTETKVSTSQFATELHRSNLEQVQRQKEQFEQQPRQTQSVFAQGNFEEFKKIQDDHKSREMSLNYQSIQQSKFAQKQTRDSQFR